MIPVLSKDITFNPIGKSDFFIHEEKYNHRIKISHDLYNFIQLIDNRKELEIIVSEYNLKYNSCITTDFAYDFLYHKLALFGIIEDAAVTVKSNLTPDYLKLSFIIINKKTVAKLTSFLRILFFPRVLWSMSMLSVLVLLTCFVTLNEEIFQTSITRNEWTFFILLSFIGVTFHEFGHAAAAHYYGANHGGIGGGFYLFMPVYFADVTDIWKLPKKERIIVNLAGIYFEFIYAAFLVFIGLLLNNQHLIILACVFSALSLYNLYPFARSDGYWVLSDAIELPNLMFHSTLKVKQVFNSKADWKAKDYFLLVYGLFNYSTLLYFFYFIVIKDPYSILYFPQNFIRLIKDIVFENSKLSFIDFSRLFIPMLFFCLLFRFLKKALPFLHRKIRKRLFSFS